MSEFKKVMIILVLVAVITAGLLYFKSQKQAKRGAMQKQQRASVEKVYVDYAKLPDKFPANIPIEKGAKITDNYSATSPEGIYQATRAFETKVSLQDNLKLYSIFLKDNGWDVKSTIDQPNIKMVAGAKDKKRVQFSIGQDEQGKVKTVTISYTEGK